MKKNLTILLIFFCNISFAQNITLQTGDFLFQIGKGSEFEKAIISSTQGLENLNYTHIGVVYIIDDEIFVLEAEPKKGVVKTPLKEFVDCGKITVVGRLKEMYKFTIPTAIKRILSQLGKAYNSTFQANGDGYYCSQLIQQSFILDNNEHLFAPIPMSFKDNETGETHIFWIEYYEKLGIPIPEGEDGSNPNMIATSEKVEIFGMF
ncbi:hypothetical protein LJC69_03120 [Bacteroidales bacterium OttesenSCG-928-K22]|nr:hypothetical protein [Bacteroidales bacterium OttesenSCG-928-L14]MDL2240598.1 hypothetical protein [Bacteroidales bacterium OttesenSCG-928-K22]